MLYFFVDFHFVCIAEESGSFAEACAEANAFTCSLVCNAEENGRFAEDIMEAISLQLFCLHSGRKRKVCGR